MYLCVSSNNSLLVSKSIVIEEIANILHKKEVGIISKSFTKIMFFNIYGTFTTGLIRDFPKSRPRPFGELLHVKFHANIVEKSTSRVSDIILKHFVKLGMDLHNDYGGNMEHLWIDLGLVEGHKPFPFRFQGRVEIPTSYTDFYSYNVGHYSVRPDFDILKKILSEEEICRYIFGLLYESIQILFDKQKKLGGFNATQFRLDFLTACEKLGYSLNP